MMKMIVCYSSATRKKKTKRTTILGVAARSFSYMSSSPREIVFERKEECVYIVAYDDFKIQSDFDQDRVVKKRGKKENLLSALCAFVSF